MADLDALRTELEAFVEWDTTDKSLVTTTTCLMFTHHMLKKAGLEAPKQPEEEQERAWN